VQIVAGLLLGEIGVVHGRLECIAASGACVVLHGLFCVGQWGALSGTDRTFHGAIILDFAIMQGFSGSFKLGTQYPRYNDGDER
jgi:hypothetical protein